MDFWNCRVCTVLPPVRYLTTNPLECRRPHPSRIAVLEPSALSRVRNALTNVVQVDEDGESYWVFESRDVSCRSISASPSNSWLALPARKPSGLQVCGPASRIYSY